MAMQSPNLKSDPGEQDGSELIASMQALLASQEWKVFHKELEELERQLIEILIHAINDPAKAEVVRGKIQAIRTVKDYPKMLITGERKSLASRNR